MSTPADAAARGLRVTDLTVVYPGAQEPAVDSVSLAVRRGQTIALLGPSGCGKSTLLAGIVGITAPDSGTVAFDGEDVTHVPIHRRGFGLVFQDGQLFPHRTVAGNIAFGLEMARVPAAERETRVSELLELVGLTKYRDQPVANLSGGERQRVALARSLAPRPRLLLLDEPLSSLDAELRSRLAGEMRDILARTGTTAILVTHDPTEAAAIASEVHRMEAGRILTRD
ncbi:MAG: ABC transporter ATP-binding protein [Demequina sp.]|uniref:ABC transporter ATP-binding protein n=1 Tax=Demequina sp. TaxID=2050685 RepID=UPI0019BCA1C5|nr:ABC transporter ATP-binding protein [Demequina sp.]MBC7299312.1 ABC transporter ATP-binding protein [Demequina sp.]